MDELARSWTHLPNLHPALVHFPIALLPAALFCDLGALLFRRHDWLARAATLLYVLAAAGGAAAVKAGELAADGLEEVAATLQPAIGRHSDYAHYAAWTLIAVAVLRLAAAWPRLRRLAVALRSLALAVAVAGLGLLAYAADLGGALVFVHGVAVARPQAPPAPAPPPPAEARSDPRQRLHRDPQGAVSWRPVAGDAAALGTLLEPAAGTPDDAVRAVAPGGGADAEPGLVLAADGRALLLLPETFGDVQVELGLERIDFDGTVGVAHHVRDDGLGLFTLSTGGDAVLLDRRDGEEKVLDRGRAPVPPTLFTLAASAAGRHLKGLLDGKTVVHGHVAPPPDGRCGLLLDGRGRVRIHRLVITPLSDH